MLNFFSLSLTVETLQAEICRSRRFSKGVRQFERKFQTEGALKTRMIALSCGSKISAVHCLVLPQSTRVTDRQTDRQTDGRTDGQTELPQLIPR